MAAFQNIAAYKFAPLAGLKDLRTRLVDLCTGHGLKGTILLSTEGINLFVAGERAGIDRLLGELYSVPGLESLEVKISESAEQPFRRMLVRIKKEIIAFGVEGIDPARRPAAKIPATTLKQWLDEGRPVTLLDTRNDYEVKLGTFRNARAIGIGHFRHFPEAVRQLPEDLKEQPIVMFCTGGIRCEKAGPFMEREGFKNIFQLEGGILKYFQQCGAAHYEGECFVFDQRVGLDPSLGETSSAQCFNCLTPLTEAEQKDSRYVAGKSCPYCFKTAVEEMAERLAEREKAIRRVTRPLPGSEPYDNFRPINVPSNCDGLPVLDFLGAVLPHIPPEQWRGTMARGLFLNSAKLPVLEEQIVRAGERYLHKLPSAVEPGVNAEIKILHEDEALIVLNKPAPLPMHPSGRFNRNTLQYILEAAYYPQKPRPAHRLDANTTGLVLIARTRHFASLLQPQFERGEVRKTYLACVTGAPPPDQFTCELPVAAGPGATGSREADPEDGLAACTEFRVLRRNADGTTLLEIRPLTGRTNQIRVHLWELGFPVCGDPTYLPGRKLGDQQTLALTDTPLCLHALQLEFNHPITRAPMKFTADAPECFSLLKSLSK